MSPTTIDLVFPVKGKTLPWDHSYPLFGALCRRQPLLHESDHPVGVFPINGAPGGDRTLQLTPRSFLRLRVPEGNIGDLLPLMGAELELDGHRVRLGNPRLEPVRPAARLFSPWVTYPKVLDEEPFLERAAGELRGLGVEGRFGLVSPVEGRSKDGKQGARSPVVRRTRSIRSAEIVGFALLIEELTVESSALLYSRGLGGRRHFGGGLFLPARSRP